jgi:hypothetical protein
VIRHLVEGGIDVYLIDNRSTDDTVERASAWLGRGLIHIEPFPAEGDDAAPMGRFPWIALLRRKEQLASELDASWFIHHDADEIRESPWPGVSLKEGIRWVDKLGYNCIDFRVLHFQPTDDASERGADPIATFRYFEDAADFDVVQEKCWKATGEPVVLSGSGGHRADFPGRRVFPIRFLLRHYPIRSQEHGVRKVFGERKNRFLAEETSMGWHVQYDSIADATHRFVRDAASLKQFDGDEMRLEAMIENTITRRVRDEAHRWETLARYWQRQTEHRQRLNENAEREIERLRIEHHTEVASIGELNGRLAMVEKDRDQWRAQAETTERMLSDVRATAAWRVVERLRRGRVRLLPEESRRGRAWTMLRRCLGGRSR